MISNINNTTVWVISAVLRRYDCIRATLWKISSVLTYTARLCYIKWIYGAFICSITSAVTTNVTEGRVIMDTFPFQYITFHYIDKRVWQSFHLWSRNISSLKNDFDFETMSTKCLWANPKASNLGSLGVEYFRLCRGWRFCNIDEFN